jgi:hypothetical protein
VHVEAQPVLASERQCFVSLTLFGEVAAVTIPGHVTTYRYESEYLQSTVPAHLGIWQVAGLENSV